MPTAGEKFAVVDDDRKAREIAEDAPARRREGQQAARDARITLENLIAKMAEGESRASS